MEALALMLIHLLTPGGLSWTRNGVPKTEEAHDVLMREKRLARPEDLCRGLPPVFEEFLRDSRKLNFAQRPNYELWLEEFRDLAADHGYGDVEETAKNKTVRENWYDVETCDPVRLEASS